MPKRFYSNLYAQVLAGIALGVLFGFLDPARAAAMKGAEELWSKPPESERFSVA